MNSGLIVPELLIQFLMFIHTVSWSCVYLWGSGAIRAAKSNINEKLTFILYLLFEEFILSRQSWASVEKYKEILPSFL